ncbi:MAG TPA: UMP kinase [Lentisphaeria bacterium]|nr:MAG: UMP kinase [Lentisphaerae bacterium GWF2_38_69]HBM15927.1 UMP kinase [Lentisphaeria bacterium]
MSSYIYKRILLKVTGEALKGERDFGFDPESVSALADTIAAVHAEGLELGIVLGAGNLWRGAVGKKVGMDPVRADYMGMLGTVMNALILKDAFSQRGISCEVQSAINMFPVAEPFDHEKAIRYLEEGRIVIFAGGTGHPFFTTDTAGALRAIEIGAEAFFKATKVNGIYSDDPVKNINATRYEEISYDEALYQNLKIMDSTAFSICRDNNLPIVVFNFSDRKNLEKVLSGDTSLATLVKNN